MSYNDGTAMTLVEAITGKWVPEQFAAEYIMHVKSNLVNVDSFTHYWRKYLKKGYKVSIPVVGSATATEVTPGTASTEQDLKGSSTSVTVDKWEESTAEISDLMEVEILADYMDAAAKSCAYAINAAMDLDVSSLFSGLGSVVGSDGQTFTDDLFILLTEQLDEADVPDDGMRTLIGDPSTKADMMKIDKFIRQDYINGMPTTNGKFGVLYNARVRITNNLTSTTTGNYGVLAHPEAIGIVGQMPPRAQLIPIREEFRTIIQVDAAWGADEIRDAFGASFYTRKQ